MSTEATIRVLTEALDFARSAESGDHISGKALALYRIASGLPAADVARAMGVSRQRISGIEAHRVTPATAQRVRETIDGLVGK